MDQRKGEVLKIFTGELSYLTFRLRNSLIYKLRDKEIPKNRYGPPIDIGFGPMVGLIQVLKSSQKVQLPHDTQLII